MRLLQLGHAFSRVETRSLRWPAQDLLPLQLGHAFSRVETPSPHACKLARSVASIGPRVLTRGNTCLSTYMRRELLASIGPRVLTRGNSADLIVLRGELNASIGPRVLTRGNLVDFYDSYRVATASIGPRVLTRGNPASLTQVSLLGQLQLGHAFSRVETRGRSWS